ncbi:uncharacterized protein TNCV_1657041 [Trichonephila clavipes]|nr:uncharacterized protein TNCV_1657041 [Trichonephila clavipes]
MDEQLKALMEGINTLKNGHEETKERMEKSQQEMQKGLDDIKNELKERMQKVQEELRDKLEKKMDNVEERIAIKKKEKIAAVEENIEKKIEEEIKRIKEQVEEKYEETEGVKACQLAASLRGEVAEILQTLPYTERLNLNSLFNALDLRFGQKYSKDYARLQIKTRLPKNGESLQKYASEEERLTNLAFSDDPVTVREIISLQYVVDGLKEGEIQNTVRMADVQNLKSALLYALKLEAATQVSRRDRLSIRGARVTIDALCESPWKSDIEKLRDEFQASMAQRQNQEKRNFKCWGCSGTGHLRRNCPPSRKKENTVSSSKKRN